MKSPVRHLSSHVLTSQADTTKHPGLPQFNFLQHGINISCGMLHYLRKSLSRGLFPFWFTL